ncbi:hypothetical protein CK203_021701 [Vitis vinifera]|uniref:Uncharacterized protein n=1 Tax=Vitis vinifera TaxID=29760 RepID=A0A438E5I3_VITVI|nr:hypothetical protein CK203_090092 [Vitis vinifera]RVX03841.1 hypothetical protein CK203_021701 [Vitis vinifera]
MAKSSSTSIIFILLLVCYIPSLESRKLLSMEQREGSSMGENLDLALLPNGPPPPSSPSGEGYAMANINGRLFTLHLPIINDRILASVPSPGVGHH